MRYESLQCLRALAALLVIWAHIKFAASLSGYLFVAPTAGAVGVDIFFVISGFVISLSAERLRFDSHKFIINRLCRIVPFYWIMSAALLAYQLRRGGSLHWHAIANTILFIPLFDFGGLQPAIHSYGWTLSFEFWFYVLFALLLAAAKERAVMIISPFLLMICVVINLTYTGRWFTPLFLFSPFTLEFAAGVLLYRARTRIGRLALIIGVPAMASLAWATLKTDALGWHLQVLLHPTLGYERALIWGGLGVSLVCISIAIDNLGLFSWPRWLISLGDCSYSIYLIQPFALLVAWYSQKFFKERPIASGIVFVLFAIFGGVVISYTIERPITKLVKKLLTPRQQSPAIYTSLTDTSDVTRKAERSS